ncbi:DUF4401 domain-containing protein [Myxococcus landrumensis]|uniref:DUF4401 domain-containing protein n=1 Tax=Myxococcus landrumensis TaxID=2813577 RepID=A0ABX7N587_9BACT|nr:DUF4401 domain-containing protein [Myxococcus landrumus]QSQ13626.1 DUF4401 domain-containing protein [Myxococcus landrumus]
MSLRPSLREVFQGLQLDEVSESRARTSLEALQRTSTASPWYVKAFAGAGAWISAAFVLSFFGCVGVMENEVIFIAVGLFASICATLLRRLATGAFVDQLTLALALAGVGMVTAGVGMTSEDVETTAVANLLLSAGLLVAFPDSIFRFIATLNVVGASLVLLWSGLGVLGVDIGVFVCAAVAQFLLIFQPRLAVSRVGEIADSVTLGLSACVPLLLLGRSTMSAMDSLVGLGFDTHIVAPPISVLTLGLTALTLYTAWHTMKELDLEPASSTGAGVFVALTLMALLTPHTPSVIASVGLLLSGFLRRNSLLLGIAVAFLLVSGSWYYYDLGLSLLAKSGALVGSGAILLALRWFLSQREPRTAVEAR